MLILSNVIGFKWKCDFHVHRGAGRGFQQARDTIGWVSVGRSCWPLWESGWEVGRGRLVQWSRGERVAASLPPAALSSIPFPALSWAQDCERVGDAEDGGPRGNFPTWSSPMQGPVSKAVFLSQLNRADESPSGRGGGTVPSSWLLPKSLLDSSLAQVWLGTCTALCCR